MKRIAALFRSTIGRKYIMALSGAVLILYVIGHLAGNLQIFFGSEVINDYAKFLHSKPLLLWIARIGLLAMVGLHIGSAMSLDSGNRSARPVAYTQWNPTAADYASRTMLMSGWIVAAFVIYHLLHFTARVPTINLTGQDFTTFRDSDGHPDVYRMLITGFRHPLVSMFYIIAVGLLSLHLSHGVSAAFQSLGIRNADWTPFLNRLARGFAVAVFLGYASIPAAVLLGLGRDAIP